MAISFYDILGNAVSAHPRRLLIAKGDIPKQNSGCCNTLMKGHLIRILFLNISPKLMWRTLPKTRFSTMRHYISQCDKYLLGNRFSLTETLVKVAEATWKNLTKNCLHFEDGHQNMEDELRYVAKEMCMGLCIGDEGYSI